MLGLYLQVHVLVSCTFNYALHSFLAPFWIPADHMECCSPLCQLLRTMHACNSLVDVVRHLFSIPQLQHMGGQRY